MYTAAKAAPAIAVRTITPTGIVTMPGVRVSEASRTPDTMTSVITVATAEPLNEYLGISTMFRPALIATPASPASAYGRLRPTETNVVKAR